MKDTAIPLLFIWDHEESVMRPIGPLSLAAAKRSYEPGRSYILTEVSGRSSKSHKQYFAAINEAWANLPEKYKNEWWSKSPETLRKYALIEEDFCDTFSFVFQDANAAMAAALELRRKDPNSEVIIREPAIGRNRVMWSTAHSQAEGKMDKAMFERSKDAVLGFLANLLDVPVADLIERGKAAA